MGTSPAPAKAATSATISSAALEIIAAVAALLPAKAAAAVETAEVAAGIVDPAAALTASTAAVPEVPLYQPYKNA